MRHLVTGGAGFIGSHIVERLLKESHDVICVDDLSTGNELNLKHSFTDDSSSLTFINHDVIKPLGFDSPIDQIWHLHVLLLLFSIKKIPLKPLELTSWVLIICSNWLRNIRHASY